MEDNIKDNIKDWLTTPLTRFTIAGSIKIWEVAGHNSYVLDSHGRVTEGCSWDRVEDILKAQGGGDYFYQVDRVYLPVRREDNSFIEYELIYDEIDTSGKSIGKRIMRYPIVK